MKNLLKEYISTLLEGEAKGKHTLSSGATLGYAAEHAVYAAMAKISKEQFEANIKTDSRISELYSDASPPEIAAFMSECYVMRQQITKRLAELGLSFKTPEKIPGGGTDEYDLVAQTKDGRGYNIHVKYKDDRLVGIPQPKSSMFINPKTGKVDKAALDAAIDRAAQENPSTIYKNVRDAFIFTGGVEGGTNQLEKAAGSRSGVLKAGSLTPAGKEIRGIQLQQVKATGKDPESEISIIIGEPDLRAPFYDNLIQAGFGDVISDSVKKQLGLAVKGEERTTMIINFHGDDVDVQRFSPGQGADVELVLVDGDTTSAAFTLAALFGKGSNRVDIMDAFRVELGSIARAKYVQIHKGSGYKEFLAALEEFVGPAI